MYNPLGLIRLGFASLCNSFCLIFMRIFSLRATLSLGVALLGGCRSSDDLIAGTTTVSGQVVVYQTNKPVPNATVQVYKSGAGGGYGVQGTDQPTDGQSRILG